MKHRNDTLQEASRILTTGAAIVAAAAIAVGVVLYNRSADPIGPLPVHLPANSGSYLGVYAKGAPVSFNGVTAFTKAIGTTPDVVMYYSGWYEPFQTSFAEKAAKNGAVPLVQMDPEGKDVTVSGIAAGKFDGYLSAYAEAVRAYRHPVILSFGHEMNGSWSSWGYPHISPRAFRGGLAAYRKAIPRARSPERDLAVDSQHHQRHAAWHVSPRPIDGGQVVPT